MGLGCGRERTLTSLGLRVVSLTGQIAFFAVVAAWVAFDSYLFAAADRGRPRKVAERRSKYLMLAGIVAGMVGGVLISPPARQAWLAPFIWSQYLGVGTILLGLLGRIFVIRWYGPGFSVEVHEPEALHTEGPYRWIRHPAYAAELLIFVGVALAYHHPLLSSLAVVLPTAGLLYRIRVEEQLLRSSFGARYGDYVRRTKRLIPFLF